jgi:hypothetical protein
LLINENIARQIVTMLLSGETVANVAVSLNVSSSIVSDIKNKRSWKDITNNIEFPHVKPNHPNRKRKVNQYSKDGEYIKTWDSATDAIEKLCIPTLSHSGIVKSCKTIDKLLCCGGYVWRYLDQINNNNNIII